MQTRFFEYFRISFFAHNFFIFENFSKISICVPPKPTMLYNFCRISTPLGWNLRFSSKNNKNNEKYSYKKGVKYPFKVQFRSFKSLNIKMSHSVVQKNHLPSEFMSIYKWVMAKFLFSIFVKHPVDLRFETSHYNGLKVNHVKSLLRDHSYCVNMETYNNMKNSLKKKQSEVRHGIETKTKIREWKKIPHRSCWRCYQKVWSFNIGKVKKVCVQCTSKFVWKYGQKTKDGWSDKIQLRQQSKTVCSDTAPLFSKSI